MRSASDRGAHRAARLLHVAAILEATIDADLMDLDEAALRGAHDARGRREIAHAGRIDDRRLAPGPKRYQRAVVVVCRPSASRVSSAVCAAACRRKRIDDRGLADARLPDEQGHAVRKSVA